jgi:tRNA A-37 threonylcarbamoyl transferase component Bud32
MREIQWLIDNVERYEKAIIQKRFPSKKNTVAYVLLNGQPRVLKWFVPGLKQNMEKEHTILKKGVSSLSIPSPFEIDFENNVIVISYIPGENICDYLNDSQKNDEDKEQCIQRLAEWFIQFHTFFKTDQGFQIRGDATLRNFIQYKGSIWGVDFEESRNGKPSEDLATFCSSLLTTDPMFTEQKFRLCQVFLTTYRNSTRWILENLHADIAYALLERIQWRPNDEELLRRYATTIRNKGLQVIHSHL